MMKRRIFIKKAGIAATAIISVPTIIPAACVGKGGQTAPSDKINLAIIGAGNQASNDVMDFLADDRVVVTLICDVNKKSDGYWDGRVAGREYIRDVVNGFYSKKYDRRYRVCNDVEDFREELPGKTSMRWK
jgi:myo-inositol 2-dehydrogenase / D-chiro-inositol 1-dehydrogenase